MPVTRSWNSDSAIAPEMAGVGATSRGGMRLATEKASSVRVR
jgi:hypothetical protein